MLAIDLFCGLGGWTDGLMHEGWDVIGFDIERHEYPGMRYPGKLVLQDVQTLDGAQFKNADLIVASPPCQEYSYMAMPWSRAKQIGRALIGEDDFPEGYTGSKTIEELNALFNSCFRIQREAIEAAGKFIPLIVENVCGCQPWTSKSRWNYGSYHLWGDIPALMPIPKKLGAVKNPGQNWSRFNETGEQSPHWNVSGIKNEKYDTHRLDGEPTYRMTTGAHEQGIKQGGDWFGDCESISRKSSSKSSKRKKASAMIAKIPFPLSQHIAKVFKPAEAA